MQTPKSGVSTTVMKPDPTLRGLVSVDDIRFYRAVQELTARVAVGLQSSRAVAVSTVCRVPLIVVHSQQTFGGQSAASRRGGKAIALFAPSKIPLEAVKVDYRCNVISVLSALHSFRFRLYAMMQLRGSVILR